MRSIIEGLLIAWATLTILPFDLGLTDLINTYVFSKALGVPLAEAFILQIIIAGAVLLILVPKKIRGRC